MLDFDSAAHTGRQYSYCTYGIAVSEIELDTLTGQHKLLETEILMDVGRSLNPRIDIGQIEGAFTQDSFFICNTFFIGTINYFEKVRLYILIDAICCFYKTLLL